ncbi:MAG: LacI family DNA-binding transcriptional regulator [Spirochaetales bacterium]|nr:LacI family DNA-binding transcriptional regulator [Spirochaetales bacterium]
MKEKVTLYHIAEELGISASTVSRVLNGSSLISDERSRLIQETATRMGYIPRNVKRQKNRAILNIQLFLPPSRETFIHLFYDVAQVLEGIQEGFDNVSLNITTRLNDGDDSFLEKKKTSQVDGCIFAFTRGSRSLLKTLEKKDIPYIHLNRKVEPAYVVYDMAREMDQLAEALYQKHGNSLKPAYLGFSPLSSVDEERWNGAKEACRKRGIILNDQDRFSLDNIEDMDDNLEEICKGDYNALFAFNDLMAMSFYQRAQSSGINIPGDLSLCGIDNSPIQQISPVRIDTIDFSVLLLGKEAGQWLYKRLIEKEKLPCRLTLDGEYIKGDTL